MGVSCGHAVDFHVRGGFFIASTHKSMVRAEKMKTFCRIDIPIAYYRHGLFNAV